ncbi:MAG TPA: hypothetical protein PLA46_07620, partial [Phycicoccus sp.]|nr:hypothetical protein [Phycicoccus sp.]
EYLQSFRAYAPDVPLDVVLADPSIGSDEGLRAACEELGAELVIAPMAARDRPGAHDRLRLAAALQDVMAWHPGTNGVAG